ncbi:hypothetical protein A2J04_03005 [Rhodococcus sp. EPR-279]|nr:hypothetical protein A2J02_13710 [Rhodococcus sp. EPR-147]KZF07560.1 hypothetical protein A2J04_03005 [Rhodococcus sp. EPR-279]
MQTLFDPHVSGMQYNELVVSPCETMAFVIPIIELFKLRMVPVSYDVNTAAVDAHRVGQNILEAVMNYGNS